MNQKLWPYTLTNLLKRKADGYKITTYKNESLSASKTEVKFCNWKKSWTESVAQPLPDMRKTLDLVSSTTNTKR